MAQGTLDREGLPGDDGEQLACRYLEKHGFAILARNFRSRAGEVDIVAREKETTVFVEVKERRGAAHGEAVEAVTFAKRQRIVRAARLFAAARGLSEAPLRFDVVAIDWTDAGAKIRHERDAFGVDG